MDAVCEINVKNAACVNLAKFVPGKVNGKRADELNCRLLGRSDSINVKNQDQRIMVAESDSMTYIGKNFGHNTLNQSKGMLRYYIGIYDEQTGKMRIYDTEIFHMLPHIPDRKDQIEVNDVQAKNYGEKLGALTHAFGTKRKKIALERRERHMVDDVTMKNILATDVQHGQEQIKMQQRTTNNSELEIQLALTPPCNMDATKAEDVYNLSDILTPADMDVLKHGATEFFNCDGATLKSWKASEKYPVYVLKHLAAMPVDQELRWKRSQCLLYLHYMILLYNMPAKRLKARDAFPMECPSSIKKKLFDNFTVLAGQTRCKPARLKDRLATYILTLCLLIDEFSLHFDCIAKDLHLGRQKISLFLRSLGCKLSHALSEGDGRATLAIPLVFPTTAGFKFRQGSKIQLRD